MRPHVPVTQLITQIPTLLTKVIIYATLPMPEIIVQYSVFLYFRKDSKSIPNKSTILLFHPKEEYQ
jgi:hypothetical protein